MKVKDVIAQLQNHDQESDVAISSAIKVNGWINGISRIQKITYLNHKSKKQTPGVLLIAELNNLNEDEDLTLL